MKDRPGKGRNKSGYVGKLRVNGKEYRSSIRKTAEEASKWYWTKRRALDLPDPEKRTSGPAGTHHLPFSLAA
jgi:hypothetical protein